MSLRRISGTDPLPLDRRGVTRARREAAFTTDITDSGRQIDASGTWALTLALAHDVGVTWWCYVANVGTGTITLTRSGSDTIDGSTTVTLTPGQVTLVTCDGQSAYATATLLEGPSRGPVSAAYVIDESGGRTINVAVTLKDSAGRDMTAPSAVHVYLADDDTGLTPTASVPADGWVIGTDGAMIEIASDKYGLVVSEADGTFDIDVTAVSPAQIWYLVVVMPDGTLSISPAIDLT